MMERGRGKGGGERGCLVSREQTGDATDDLFCEFRYIGVSPPPPITIVTMTMRNVNLSRVRYSISSGSGK